MGVEDQFYSVRWQSLLNSHAGRGSMMLDGYSKEFLEKVPVSAQTPLKKGHVCDYTELWEFMLSWKDFDSPAVQAFGRFVEAISHTFESGRRLHSDLQVQNINDTCVFAPPRVMQIWEDALRLVEAENLKACVEAVWDLEMSFRYSLGTYPEFAVRFGEMKAVWFDAVQKGHGIVIARW